MVICGKMSYISVACCMRLLLVVVVIMQGMMVHLGDF